MYRIITFKQNVYSDKPHKSRKLYDVEGNKNRYWNENKQAADRVNRYHKYNNIQEQWCVLEKYNGTQYVELERYPANAPVTGPGHLAGQALRTTGSVLIFGTSSISQLIP